MSRQRREDEHKNWSRWIGATELVLRFGLGKPALFALEVAGLAAGRKARHVVDEIQPGVFTVPRSSTEWCLFDFDPEAPNAKERVTELFKMAITAERLKKVRL